MCLELSGTLGQTSASAWGGPSFLALWNRPKLVLQTLGKLAIRLIADHKLNLPVTFGHFRSDQAHAQGHAESSKSFLALWNRPKQRLWASWRFFCKR